jgi:hypothetical protein
MPIGFLPGNPARVGYHLPGLRCRTVRTMALEAALCVPSETIHRHATPKHNARHRSAERLRDYLYPILKSTLGERRERTKMSHDFDIHRFVRALPIVWFAFTMRSLNYGCDSLAPGRYRRNQESPKLIYKKREMRLLGPLSQTRA